MFKQFIEKAISKNNRGYLFAIFTALLSSVLYVAAFPPFNIAESSSIFALPWLIWFTYRPPLKSVFWAGLGSGWVSWLSLLFWLRHVTWTGTIFLALLLALVFTAWLIPVRWVWPKILHYPVWQRICIVAGLAGLWTLLEYTRTFIFTGFPWLPLAASQWNRPALLQILAFTGFYGLSFILIFFNMGLALYLYKLFRSREKGPLHRSLCVEFYLALALLLFAFGLSFQTGFFQKKDDRSIKVGLVQPYIPYNEKWDQDAVEKIRTTLKEQSHKAKKKGAEIILWPEAATPYPAFNQGFTLEWITSLSNEIGLPILMGSLAVQNEQWSNIICICRPEEGLLPVYYSKRRLVPFGEYIPQSEYLPFLKKVIPIGNFSPGDNPSALSVSIDNDIYRFGPLVCYEDIFPHLAKSYGKMPVDFIFVATNNAWYGEEAGAHQHAIHSILRAVETRRPVLRSGNGGWSGWIDAYGRIRYEMTDTENIKNGIYFRGTAVIDVHFDSQNKKEQSFYSQKGDWFIAICGLFTLATFFITRVNG